MKRKKAVIIVTTFVLVAAIAVGYYWWLDYQKNNTLASARPEKVCHVVPAKDEFGYFDTPCVVTVGLIDYSRTDLVNDKQYLLSLIESGRFDASINMTDEHNAAIAELGIYYLDVAPGQEDRLVEYLNAHTRNPATDMNVISFAHRSKGCVGDHCGAEGN